MKMMKCLVDGIVVAPRDGAVEALEAGSSYDFDRVITTSGDKPYTLGEALAGREDAFEPVAAPATKPAPKSQDKE
jgi:hypothetical protein